MGDRKPLTAGTVESIAEQKIREARDEGAFDRLAGAGKPFVHKPYKPDWWIEEKLKREQVSLLPPALELRREVERELVRIDALGFEDDVRAALAALNARIRKVASTITSGPALDVGLIDVEAFVARWRARR